MEAATVLRENSVTGEGTLDSSSAPSPLQTHEFMGVECLLPWQVASILGVTRRTVHYLARKGKLKTVSNPVAVWGHFSLEAVLAFAAHYVPGRGGPRKADYFLREAM